MLQKNLKSNTTTKSSKCLLFNLILTETQIPIIDLFVDFANSALVYCSTYERMTSNNGTSPISGQLPCAYSAVFFCFCFLSCSVLSHSLGPHGLYSPWNSPGQNTGVDRPSLLQRIFPTQGSNPGLPHFRRILYQLSHKGSPLY